VNIKSSYEIEMRFLWCVRSERNERNHHRDVSVAKRFSFEQHREAVRCGEIFLSLWPQEVSREVRQKVILTSAPTCILDRSDSKTVHYANRDLCACIANNCTLAASNK
jgi:hypothetical protein